MSKERNLKNKFSTNMVEILYYDNLFKNLRRFRKVKCIVFINIKIEIAIRITLIV